VKLQFDMAHSRPNVAFDGATSSLVLIFDSCESNWKWWGPVGMWVKPGEPVGIPCGQARGQAQPVHRLSISGCPWAERSEPGGRVAIIHISTGPGLQLRLACCCRQREVGRISVATKIS